VDEYFDFLDDLGDRTQTFEDQVFERHAPTDVERLLDLKHDLIRLRQVVAPGRDAVNVLLRRDPPVLDPARIPYFQDIYDHLIRVADSIDTYRELATGLLDALLSIQNNRLAEQNNQLSEVVRKLTILSTIFLPLMLVTSFFGMNFQRLTGASDRAFLVGVVFMVVFEIGVVVFLRWWGILGRRKVE
jgi:magnesium transporter